MRVALLHNSSSGSENHEDAELGKLIRRAGHELVHVVHRVGELTAALHAAPCDLVVVAGGDGTVGRAACELAGWPVSLSILALGTANNTARSLNLPRRHERVARSWHGAQSKPFDIGLVGDGALRRRFAEAAGWGVFPSVIADAKRRAPPKSVGRTLKRDRKLFRAMAHAATPSDFRIELDGRDLSGAYLLVEIMNVPLLGPRLLLSPKSDPADGSFELVLATEEHRPALELLATTGSLTHPVALRIERGARIHIETSNPVMHCDGRLWRHDMGTRSYEIDVEPGAVHYLTSGPT
jgi:diacylglycerol kinase (ATP)